MSWEVLTMRSAKSFFNGAIARSDLRRYWPVLFLYVGLWLLFLPIPVWNRAAERNPALVNLTELCADTYATAVVLALIFGGIMATAVFSYLMQTRSVGAMHALPQRRGTLFWTHFLTGWAMLAAGNLLVLAVTALTALLGGLALTPALLTWFVVATLLDLIFLALGTLCAMVTGWLLAVPVLYAAVNCLAVALTWLGQQLAELLLDGFTMPDVQPVITRWLTPVYQLICDLGQSGPKYSPFLTGKLPENYIQNADCASGLTPQGWRTLLIFTAVAGADGPVPAAVRPAEKRAVRRCGGLFLDAAGVPAGRGAGRRSAPGYAAVCPGVRGPQRRLQPRPAVRMHGRDGHRVLSGGGHAGGQDPAGAAQAPARRGGDGAGAGAAVRGAAGGRVRLRRPDAPGGGCGPGPGILPGHQLCLEDLGPGRTLPGSAPGQLAENHAADANYRMTFEVHYVLKDGTSMARCYRLAMTEPVKAALEQVARLEEVQTYVMFNGNVPPSGWQPTGGDLWLKNTIETRELTAEEAQALYDAAWRDIRAENVLPVDGDYAWLGVEITLFRDGDRYTISSTKSSYKELTQALLDLGIPAEDIGEINID